MKAALETLGEMKLAECPRNNYVYNELIVFYSKRKQAEEAEKVLYDMQSDGVWPNVVNYSSVMHAWALLGSSDRARGVLQLMTLAGICPDTTTYNTLLRAYADRDADGAQAVVAEMKSKGVPRDIRTYNTLIRAYARTGYPLQAEHVLAELTQDKTVSEHPNDVTFNSIMHSWAIIGKVQKCRSILRQMQVVGVLPDATSYNTLMRAYSEALPPDAQGARSVLEEMKRRAVPRDLTTYSTLVKAYVAASEPMELQLNLLEEMENDHVTPDAAIMRYILNGMSEKAARHVLQPPQLPQSLYFLC